jgi:XTP/dITP diphosphohydrolase
MLDVVIATGNRHKFRELTRLLAVPGVRFHSLAEFPRASAARETGRTFEENAVQKARAVAQATGHLALADDSGLEVEALGWGPGVRSARFSGRHGDDRANNEKLLRCLSGMPPSRRRARYRCVLALAQRSQTIALARGVWRGRIAARPRGRSGFGYDPLFVVPRLHRTAGELPPPVKARLSHRAAAARRLKPLLRRLASDAARRRSVAKWLSG